MRQNPENSKLCLLTQHAVPILASENTEYLVSPVDSTGSRQSDPLLIGLKCMKSQFLCLLLVS